MASKNSGDEIRIVIIGGGITGVCCAQELIQLSSSHMGSGLPKKLRIILISATETLKETKSVMKITNHLEEISVYERRSDAFRLLNPHIEVIQDSVTSLDPKSKLISLHSGQTCPYDKVCICSGASPMLFTKHPNIIGIRDLESVQDLANRLKTARKVAIVGNGGISLELVHELRFCDISWIIRDQYLGNTFFDATASAFILPSLLQQHVRHSHVPSQLHGTAESPVAPVKATTSSDSSYCGVALGPEWVEKTKLRERIESSEVLSHVGRLEVEYGQEVCGILSSPQERIIWQRIACSSEKEEYLIPNWTPESTESSYPLFVHTTENKIIGCDFIISAIGVRPCTSFLASQDDDQPNNSSKRTSPVTAPAVPKEYPIHLEPSTGAIIINECFETSCRDAYAAGDCCTVLLSDQGDEAGSGLQSNCSGSAKYHRHWFQMRLWSQARSMGIGAAHSIFNSLETYSTEQENSAEALSETLEEFQQRADDIWGGVMFNIFAHVTHFFDYKVVLLGRYNGQGLGAATEKYIKEMVVTPDGLIKEKYRNSVAQGAVDLATSVQEEEERNAQSRLLDCYYQQPVNEETSTSTNLEIWTRITPQEEYVKLVIYRGRVIGALLIGDTDLEEVCENLILNELDVRRYGMDLLDPDIDIEDYFD